MVEQSVPQSTKEELVARRKGEFKLGRNHEPWSDDELQRLYDMYYGGEDISAIAIKLERSETAIFNRLRIDGIMQETNRKRNRYCFGGNCQCSKCETRFICTKNKEYSTKSTQDVMLDYQ